MMLNQWKRGLSAAAALALALTLALPASAADPLASGGFAVLSSNTFGKAF